jgi:hypothetical protein
MQIENGAAGQKLDVLNPNLYDEKLAHNKKGLINPLLPMFETRFNNNNFKTKYTQATID